MADTYQYQTGNISLLGLNPLFDLIKAAGIFLGSTVGNGWQLLDYSGKDRADTEYEEFIDGTLLNGATWNPLADTWNNGDGDGLISLPSAANGTARSVYLRWSDGGSDTNENYYFLTTINVSGSAYDTIRTGVLLKPHTSALYTGTYPFVPSYNSTTGWGSPPSDPLEGVYPYWPTPGTHTPPPSPDFSGTGWSYREQPGYKTTTAKGDCITNRIIYGAGTSIDYFFFGGVHKGTPYFYCAIQNEQYFSHFGIGRLMKLGNWKGGQFASGIKTSSVTTYAQNYFDDANARPLDSRDSQDTGGNRSYMMFSTDLRPYDSGDDTTLPEYKLFGSSNNGVATWESVWSDIHGGKRTTLDDDSPNEFNGRCFIMPHTVSLPHPEYSLSERQLIGLVPCMAGIKIDDMLAGDEITHNGETWKVFPCRKKYGATFTGEQNSGLYGFAYRKA